MKLNKQAWLVIAIILVGIAAAGFILKTDKPVMDEHGHGEHAEEAGEHKDEHAEEADIVMPPKHGEPGHDHEKDHQMPAQKIQKDTIQKESDDGHNHATMQTESTKGPHGGKLFTDGDYAVEVTIF